MFARFARAERRRPALSRAVVVGLLAGLGCGADPIDKPQAPDMSALVRAYEKPDGTFDEAAVAGLEAALLERVPIVARLGFDVTVAGAVDAAVDASEDPPKETESVPGSGPETPADGGDSLLQGDGYLTITRLCDGWQSPAVAAKENGFMALNVGFSDEGIDPVVWGTLTECKYVYDGTPVTVGGRGNDDDGDVRIHIARRDILSNPMLFDLNADVLLGAEAPREVDFDFRILPSAGFELRLPGTNGAVVVQVVGGNLGAIRADNGTFTCDLAAGTCTDESGEVVKL